MAVVNLGISQKPIILTLFIICLVFIVIVHGYPFHPRESQFERAGVSVFIKPLIP